MTWGALAVDDVPAWVLAWCRRAGLQPEQVRWCEWCRVVAFAIDHHQRSLLDAVGFTGVICPECAYPASRDADGHGAARGTAPAAVEPPGALPPQPDAPTVQRARTRPPASAKRGRGRPGFPAGRRIA
jgi:hypothetical protein